MGGGCVCGGSQDEVIAQFPLEVIYDRKRTNTACRSACRKGFVMKPCMPAYERRKKERNELFGQHEEKIQTGHSWQAASVGKEIT